MTKWKKTPQKPPEDLRTLKAKQSEEWFERVQELYDLGLIKDDKVYIGQNDTHKAYAYVLDTGEGAVPALEYVALDTNKPETWVDDVKHSPIGKQMLKRVIERNGTHPVSQQMKSKDVLTRSSKRAVSESKTVSSALNALSDMVNLNSRLSQLEDRVDALESDNTVLTKAITALISHAGTTEERLDTLESGVSELSKQQLKEKALQLHKSGYSVQEISKAVGKSRPTIYNWIKEINKIQT